MTANDDYILDILESVGMIDHALSAKARAKSEQSGKSAVDTLVESGLISKSDIFKTLASQSGLEFVSLKGVEIEQDIIDAMPADVVHRYKAVPVWRSGASLTVAISDPLDVDTIDSLRYILKTHVEPVVALEDEIKSLIKLHYPASAMSHTIEEMTQSTLAMAITDTAGLGTFGQDPSVTEEDAPIIKLVSLLIMQAFRDRSSDIHIEPMEGKLRVRYRVDGVLQERESPPKRLQSAIIQRIKIMSNMQIAEKRVPQDGRIQINVMGRDLDLRVSSIPSRHGESIVMRILDKEGLSLGLPQLGFLSDDQATFEQMIHMADGIVLVTGPTGSGKTTTLYGCLNEINKSDRKIITVEDPVEYQMTGINQVHVRADIGLTFSTALRSILRQAPNIIMIGEIRDLETAEIAVNASLTGHLVFSTLHTNDAPGAVTRLVDIGVKPYLVASSVRGIMAQRLVRKICEKCKKPHTPDDREVRLLGQAASQLSEAKMFRGEGCPECNYSGYRGRLGIFEIMVVNEEMQRLIYEQVPTSEIRAKAREMGMRTLREDGVRKVVAGLTTLDEVFRVTMGDSE